MAMTSTERSRRHRAKKRNGHQPKAVAPKPCDDSDLCWSDKLELALLRGEISPIELDSLGRILRHIASQHWGCDAHRRRRRRRQLVA